MFKRGMRHAFGDITIDLTGPGIYIWARGYGRTYFFSMLCY